MTLLRQIWTMSAVYLIILSSEMKPNEKFDTNITCIGTVLGLITSSVLMDKIGRRLTYILGIAPGLVSCLHVTSRNNQTVMIGEVMSNLSYGCTSILGLIIIGEYTSPKYRLIFLNLTTTAMYLGQLSNTYLSSLRLSTMLNVPLILKFIALIITLTWPESPYWLKMIDQREDSEASFDKLRGTDKSSLQEKQDLLNRENTSLIQEKTLMERMICFMKKYTSKKFKRPFTAVLFGAILVEASGRTYLPIYAPAFFTAVTDQSVSEYYIPIMIVASSIYGCILMGIFRNRKLLLITGLTSVTAMFLGSSYGFLSKNKLVSTESSYLGLVFILSYIIFANLGATSIPMSHMGEVFSMEYKGIGLLTSGITTSVVSWVVMKLATILLVNLHVYGTLMVFGLIMTLSLLFLFVILPDTKGRTLMEIEEYFDHGWFNDDEFENKETQLMQI